MATTLQLTATATPSAASIAAATAKLAASRSSNPKAAKIRNKNAQARSRYNANKARLKRKKLATKLAALAAPKVISTVKAKPIPQNTAAKLNPATKITVQHTVQVWLVGVASYTQQLVQLQCYAQQLTSVGTLICYVPKTRTNPIAQHIIVSCNPTGLQHSYTAVQNTPKTLLQLQTALAYLSNPATAIAAAKATKAKAAAAAVAAATPKTAKAIKAATTRANNKAKAAAVALHNKRYALASRH